MIVFFLNISYFFTFCQVIYNQKGWMNQETTEQFIDLACGHFRFEQHQRLLIMDSFSAHISEKTKEYCKKRKVVPIIIPAGCTSILQGES